KTLSNGCLFYIYELLNCNNYGKNGTAQKNNYGKNGTAQKVVSNDDKEKRH
ncbi:hypothetical protein HMPREF3191_00119, partial [Veillonellaceae bacterium DNF00626]